MYGSSPLDAISIWLVFLLTLAFVLACLELGFRLGRYRAAADDIEKEASVGAMANASLALLAFLLAFSFGFAASRLETRRTLLVDETNAIGTAYLRTSVLPEPQRAEARALLREYTDVRIAAAMTGTIEPAVRRSLELQTRLWEPAAALAERNPGSIVLGLYLQALNQMIDLHTTRLTQSVRVRIPFILWVVIFGVTALSMGEMGYQTGLGGRRRPRSIPAFALAFSSVILLIADLDRPQGGWIRVGQEAIIELRQSMGE